MTPERLQQIDNLLGEALGRTANERVAFLDQACKGDEELRREVEALLTAHERAESFIETPASAAATRALAEQAPSMVGRQFGHYQVLALIGAGGMGEVYLAEDTRLDRKVAIKFLPSQLAADERAKQRLIREAKAAAKLDHPNICSVYEVGEEDGRAFIVMQYVEGETLASRIQRKPVELREVLEIGVQISDGLAEAHSLGIIHRDIKPQNIMISARGQTKVTDFGLARIGVFGAPMDSQVETQGMLTAPGMIVGTVPYMSPEQVRGEKAEAPSDIFSLGCVLYELVTGHRAFAHQTATETMAAILRDEPPKLARAGKDFPPQLEVIITRCLEKKADDRFHSARDLNDALRAMMSGPIATVPSRARLLRQIPPAAWVLVTAIVLAGALVSAILYSRRAPAGGGVIDFSIPLPGTWITIEVENQFLAVAPDGQRLAFVVESEGQRMLWVRPRDANIAKALTGTEGASSPFWSPDSRSIAFFAEGKLKKIVASAGPSQTLCTLPIRTGTGTWSRDGDILLAGQGGRNEGIYRVSDVGGEATLVMKREVSRGDGFLFWPHFLPDGRHFLYLSGFRDERKGDTVFIGSLDTGQSFPLIENSSRVEYAPPGYLLYVREGTLLAHPFDAAALKFTGDPIPIAEQMQYFNPTGYADFSVSEGLLAYRAGVIASRLVWFDRYGREQGVVGAPGQYAEPRLSPDEKRVAVGRVDSRSGTVDIWVLDLTRELETRITTTRRYTEYGPIWSPDGRHLAFSADLIGTPHLYRKMASGAGDAESLVPPTDVQWAEDWSADGRFIVYAEAGARTGTDIWVLPLEGDRKPFPFLTTPFNEKEPRLSRDGRWVAYVSDESGKNEVYVQPFQKSGEKWRISTNGGSQPVWRRDGKELFYLAGDNKLMAVAVKAGANFEAGVPAVLFRTDPATEHAYDVTADGQRFLVNTNVTRVESLPITAVINWAAGLKP